MFLVGTAARPKLHTCRMVLLRLSGKIRVQLNFPQIFPNCIRTGPAPAVSVLNFRQLHHFWSVARAGGIVRAAAHSGLAPQTLSGQIATLESELGVSLFERRGRGLALTDAGRMALDYAEEIFRLGNELEDALHNRASGHAAPFRVGVADVLPKAIAWQLLAPSLQLPRPQRIVCREGKFDALLGELAVHKLDVVLADCPMPPNMDVRGYSHKLGESSVDLFAAPTLAERLQGEFPACLERAPMLLPGAEASVRGPLLRWLDREQLHPRIVGEFDDSGLMRACAEAGVGVFASASRVSEELCRQGRLVRLGTAGEVTESYFAVSVERRLTHPAVRAISDAANAGALG